MRKILLFLGILSLSGCATYKFLAGDDVWINGKKYEKGCYNLTHIILFGDFPLKVTASDDEGAPAVQIGDRSEHEANHYKYAGGGLIQAEPSAEECEQMDAARREESAGKAEALKAAAMTAINNYATAVGIAAEARASAAALDNDNTATAEARAAASQAVADAEARASEAKTAAEKAKTAYDDHEGAADDGREELQQAIGAVTEN